MRSYRVSRHSKAAPGGFTRFTLSVLVCVGFWPFTANADPLSEKKIVDVREMSVKERASLGERLVFGMTGRWFPNMTCLFWVSEPRIAGFAKDTDREVAQQLWAGQ